MKYLADFLAEIEKIQKPDGENRLNRLNPAFDGENLEKPDGESLLNLLNPVCEYSAPGAIPPADGLQRRGAFIMPTRETLPAYRAHFDAKAVPQFCETDGVKSVSVNAETDPQTERIRKLAADISPAELLAAHRTIKPTLKNGLSAIDLHELALTLACADKREKSRTSAATRPAREFYPADVYQPEKQAKGDC